METVADTLQRLVTSPGSVHPAGRALAYSACFLALDVFISRGPLVRPILRLFRVRDAPGSPAAKRLASQVAARLVGCVFLAIMFPNAFASLASKDLQADKLYAVNPISTTTIAVAAGYFLYDIFICTVHYSQNGPAFLLHSVLCCAAYGYPLFAGCLHYMGASYLMWELSTPMLYVRWVLLKAGHAGSRYMSLANAAFVAAFFGCRVVFGPIMSWDFWVTTQADMARGPRPGTVPVAVICAYYLAMVTLNSLNYYWFFHMACMALGVKSKDKDFKNKAA